MGKELSRWNPDDVELILRGITVSPAEMKTLQGMTVYHGTIDSEILNVRMGPKNIGEGFGGAGLYVDADYAVADAYAFTKGQFRGEPVVLKGSLKFSEKTRLARISIADRNQLRLVNLAEGIFPPDWAKNPTLQSFMHQHFDAIEVIDTAESYATHSDRFLVIHERAGAEAIDWSNVRYKNKAWEALPEIQRYRSPYLTFDEQLEAAIALKRLPDYYSTKPHPINIEPKANTWFKRVVDAGHIGVLFKCLRYGLTLGEGAIRYWDESAHYPDLSSGAHLAAAGTGMALDIGIFERLLHVMRPGFALGSLVVMNELSHLSYEMRNVNYQELSEKRHVLLKLLDLYEIESEAQQYLIDDFDKGGLSSRRFIESAYYSTWPVQKILEYAYRTKEAVIGLGRVIGQGLFEQGEGISQRHGIDEPAVNVTNDHLLGVNYIMREKAQLPIYFMDKVPENKDDDALPMPEQAEADEAFHVDKAALNEAADMLKTYDDINAVHENMHKMGGGKDSPPGFASKASLQAFFSSENITLFFAGIERAYHLVVNAKEVTEVIREHKAALKEQVAIARLIFDFDPIAELDRVGEITSTQSLAMRFSRDHVEGDIRQLFEAEREIEILRGSIADTQATMQRYEGLTRDNKAIQGTLKREADKLNKKISKIKDNKVLQYLSAALGMFSFVSGSMVAGTAAAGNVAKGAMAYLTKANPFVAGATVLAGIGAHYVNRKATKKVNKYGKKLAKNQQTGTGVNAELTHLEVGMSHMQQYLMQMRMQELQLALFCKSPDEIIAGYNTLIGEYDTKINKNQETINGLVKDQEEAKPKHGHGALKSPKGHHGEHKNHGPHCKHAVTKKGEEAAPEKKAQDAEDKRVVGDLEDESTALRANKTLAEQDRDRIIRQKTIRDRIYKRKQEKLEKEFPGWSKDQIDDYLLVQDDFNEELLAGWSDVDSHTQGWQAILVQSTGVTKGITDVLRYDLKWLSPEAQLAINGIANAANQLFNAGTTIAKLGHSFSRAAEGGFGVNNILSFCASPILGLINMGFSIWQGFNPPPDPVLEALKSVAKQMHAGFSQMNEKLNYLGKLGMAIYEQDRQMLHFMVECFDALSSMSHENHQETIGYLEEIKHQLEQGLMKEIVAPSRELTESMPTKTRQLKDSMKDGMAPDMVWLNLLSPYKAKMRDNLLETMDARYAESKRRAGVLNHRDASPMDRPAYLPEVTFLYADEFLFAHLERHQLPIPSALKTPLPVLLSTTQSLLKVGEQMILSRGYQALGKKLPISAMRKRGQALEEATEMLKSLKVMEAALANVMDKTVALNALAEEKIAQRLQVAGDPGKKYHKKEKVLSYIKLSDACTGSEFYQDGKMDEKTYFDTLKKAILRYDECVFYLQDGIKGSLTKQERAFLNAEAILIYRENNSDALPLIWRKSHFQPYLDKMLRTLREKDPALTFKAGFKLYAEYSVKRISDDPDGNTPLKGMVYDSVCVNLFTDHSNSDEKNYVLTKIAIPLLEIPVSLYDMYDWYSVPPPDSSVIKSMFPRHLFVKDFSSMHHEIPQVKNFPFTLHEMDAYRKRYDENNEKVTFKFLDYRETIKELTLIQWISPLTETVVPAKSKVFDPRNPPAPYKPVHAGIPPQFHLTTHYSKDGLYFGAGQWRIPTMRSFGGLLDAWRTTACDNQFFNLFIDGNQKIGDGDVKAADLLVPVPKAVLDNVQGPLRAHTENLNEPDIQRAYLELKEAVFSFLSLFKLTTRADGHLTLLTKLHVLKLYAALGFEGNRESVKGALHEAYQLSVIYSANREAILKTFREYHRQYIEPERRSHLVQLDKQMQRLKQLEVQLQKEAPDVDKYAGASFAFFPQSRQSSTINRSASPPPRPF